MANGNNPGQGGQGQKGQKKQQKPERIRLIHGKNIKEENGQFVVVFEALVRTKDGKDIDAGRPVSFYNENLEKLKGGDATNPRGSVTDPSGKIQYEHKEPLINAGKTIKIRCQIDGSPDEKWDEVELPEKPAYKVVGSARPWKKTFTENWGQVRSNPKGFLRLHFLRPTIVMLLVSQALHVVGSGFSFLPGIIMGAFVAWKLIGRFERKGYKMASLGLATILFLMFYFFPNTFVKSLNFGVMAAYLVGGLFYLVEELSKDKEGKPIFNWYPWWPYAFFIIMVAINILSVFIAPGGDQPQVESDGIYESSSEETDGLLENVSKDVRDIFDWLASILILLSYTAFAELMDFVGRRKEKKEEKPVKEKDGELGPWWRSAQRTSIVVEVAEMATTAVRWLFGKKRGDKK